MSPECYVEIPRFLCTLLYRKCGKPLALATDSEGPNIRPAV